MESSIQINREALLLVEGQEEVSVFSSLAKHEGIDESLQVMTYSGRPNLKRLLQALKGMDGFEDLLALGVEMDAEASAEATTSCIRNALLGAGFTSPPEPGQVVGASPAIGFIVLPMGAESGALERVFLDSIAAEDDVRCVDAFMTCMKAAPVSRAWNQVQEDKARAYTYLASRQSPKYRLGEYAKAGLMNFGHPSFVKIRDFVRLLSRAASEVDGSG